MVTTNATSSTPNTGVTPVATTEQGDALGTFGVALTRYHVGDALEILGFFLAIATFVVARSARSAARAALARRDELELASLLSDIAANLHQVRGVLELDDWSGLSERINNAVHVINRIASSKITADELALTDRMRNQLRELQNTTSGVKDATKHLKLRRTQGSILLTLIDAVDKAKLKRVKNDDLPY
jgi:hypothetical protein